MPHSRSWGQIIIRKASFELISPGQTRYKNTEGKREKGELGVIQSGRTKVRRDRKKYKR